MKLFAFILMLACVVSVPVAEAQWSNNSGQELSAKEKRKQAKQEAKQARMAAAQHYKEYIVQKRKACILVKKIEDERSRNASIRSFKLLYESEEVEDDEDSMNSGRIVGRSRNRGAAGNAPSDEATKTAMDAERKKYERQIKKIDTQIEAETSRIEEAGLMTDELQDFIKKALE